MKRSAGSLGIAEILRESARPAAERRVGVEVERIGIWADGSALHYWEYHGKTGTLHPGAEDLLSELGRHHNWKSTTNEKGEILGFSADTGKVSLEPGSQLEFSADPTGDLGSQVENIDEFESQVEAVTKPWGLHWVGLGVNPFATADEIDVIPSTRYQIMTEYFGKTGRLGTSMMRLTSSVQVNLDYSSELEAIEMIRASLTLSPLMYVLFANSPFFAGRLTEHLSFRSQIWKETDQARIGLLAPAFDKDFNFEKYADYVFHRPLMFAQDEKGHYVAAHGHTLGQIGHGKLPHCHIDENNRMNSLRELFTESRIKPGYIEIRSIDGLPRDLRYASVAFLMGILYQPDGRKHVLERLLPIVGNYRDKFFTESVMRGFSTQFGKESAKKIALEFYDLAHAGLKARGHGEEKFLKPLQEVIEREKNPAQQMIELFRGEWKGDLTKAIEYCS